MFTKIRVIQVVLILTLLMGTFGVGPARATPSISFDWAKRMGGSSYDAGIGLAVDGNGNVYTTGHFSGTVDFNPGANTYNLTSAGDVDSYVSKLNTNGGFVWAKRFGGISADSGSAIVLDENGNIYTIGGFNGTVDFNPGVGVNNLSSAGSTDVYISKWDANGNYVWARSIGGVDYDDGNQLTVDGTGNVYITGHFSGTADFDPGANIYNLTSAGSYDIFLAKLDASGNLVWAKRIGGTSMDVGNSLAVDGSNNIYGIGSFVGTVDFDPGAGVYNLNTGGYADIFINKLDANGDFIWAKRMGGTSGDTGSDIKLDEAGYIYGTGSFQNTVDFDPGAGTANLTSAGYDDIFVSKFDNSGNYVWAKAMGGTLSDNSYDLELDANGNVYSGGGFSATVDFDPGIGTYDLTSAGNGDVFISKLDSNGDFVSARHMGGTQTDYAWSLAVDETGNVYSLGNFSGTADFDPGTGIYNLTGAGYLDVFISKLAYGQKIHYVKKNAQGANNGTSWANAYTSLQSALDAATTGDEIWVAAGTYKPTKGTDNTISFELKDGVAIYGGFAGSETLLTQRNPLANITVLSGDLGALGNASDNSFRVVSANGVSNTTSLDGFTITGGNAIATYPYNSGGGLYNNNSSPTLANLVIDGNLAEFGGGIYNEASSNPHVSNVTIIDNTATSDGGGMYNANSSPELTNVTFRENFSYDRGGGMYNLGSDPVLANINFTGNAATAVGGGIFNDTGSDPSLTNVTFQSNTAVNGGGMSNLSSNPTLTNVSFTSNSVTAVGDAYGGGMDNQSSSPTLTNVSFTSNSAKYGGGGMSNYLSNPILNNVTFSANTASVGGGMYNRGSNPAITNSTLSGNSATNAGGGIFNFSNSYPTLTNVTFNVNSAFHGGGIYNADNSGATLRNSILYVNYGGQIYNNNIAAVVTYSIVYGGYAGTGNLDADPLLGSLQSNGGLTQTMALGAGSPAIDAGDDAVCPAADQRGVKRPQGSHCDIGAYEVAQVLALPSVALQDGWILESTETSNKGGKLNAAATTFNLGDDAANKQYRSILSFDTTALPQGAVIIKVKLNLKKAGVAGGGNPINTFKGFVVDLKNGEFGTVVLEPADFKTAGDMSLGPFKPVLVNGWYSLDLTAGNAQINRSGNTQIRLRFKLDDNNNLVANYLKLYSGDADPANQPQLIIEYYIP